MSAEDDRRAARSAELEERREEKGRLAGDRFVRIVRTHQREFRRRAPGHYVATTAVLEPETPVGRFIEGIRQVVIGPRLASEAEATERVSKKTGLAVFASDNISSSAYATEETMRVLALAGVATLGTLTLPITLAIVAVLVVVVLSYLQAIRAYPGGGGAYIVASDNLGKLPGLIAAASLLIDYVLTVSVSVAAGVAAIGAAWPLAYEHRVVAGVLVIVLLTLGNLRGIRESGNIFAAPTYLYLVSLGAVLVYGSWLYASGSLPRVSPPAEWFSQVREPLGVLLILRAFASGAVALTGTEAIANGVPAFKPPEARNASITLILMGTFFGALFVAISFLGTHMGVVPDPSEQQTVLSQVAAGLVGESWLFYLLQIATAFILLLAANTSFSGFPRLASILSQDRFMPRQFALRGERLAFSTGIVALAVVSAALLAAFHGSVTALIPLYTIGVFVAFTLSQAGLVRRWRTRRGRGWRVSMTMNALGAVATGVVAFVVAVTKFEFGAWMVILTMPIIVAVLAGVHRHYREVEDALAIAHPREALQERVRPLVIVPVGRLDRATVQALAVARQMSADVTALHVSDDPQTGTRMQERWRRLVSDVPLVVIESPYRAFTEPLLAYIDAVDKGDPQRPVLVVLSEFVPSHWWEWVLHNQTALRLKLRLFFRPNTVVLDVPYRMDLLDEEVDQDTA